MSYERVGGTLMTNKENNFPKRRFKKFELSGPWEARFLGELVKLNPKGQLPQTFEYVDLESVVGTEMVSHRKVTRDTAPSRAQRLAQSGDLFYQTVRPYQKNNFLATNLNGDYVFSTGYAQLRPLISGYFLLSLVQNDRFVKSVLSRCTGTSYPSISADELSKIQVLVSNDEQELYAIGKLFQKLDRLIILHQHKLDKLKNLKKAYLSEMFPAEGKRVPKRRFPGFEGEWEQKKLGDIAEIYDGTHQTPRYTHKGVMFLSVENIKTLKSSKYISKDDFIKDFKIFPQNGDVLMTRIGDIGTSNVVNTDSELAFYVSLALIRSSVLDSNFLNISISSSNFQKELWRRTLHIAFPKKINKNEIGEVSILFPCIAEQKQIGEFFHKLDNSITLQQQKLDKLNDLKKAYLNELFV